MRCVENVTNHTFKYLITLKYFTDQKLCIGAWNCTQNLLHRVRCSAARGFLGKRTDGF